MWEATLRRIDRPIRTNLAQAVAGVDQMWVYDKGEAVGLPLLAERGAIRFLAGDLPAWLAGGPKT